MPKPRTPYRLPICGKCGLPVTRATISTHVHVGVVVFPGGHEVVAVSPSRGEVAEEVYEYARRNWPTKDTAGEGRLEIPLTPPADHLEAIGLYFGWSPTDSYSISKFPLHLLKSGRAPDCGPGEEGGVG